MVLARTSLRTKLITAMLVLVILALVAISIASSTMLRSYLTTQNDTTLAANFPPTGLRGATVGEAYTSAGNDFVVGIQQPGRQLSWSAPATNLPFSGSGDNLPLPKLPTGDWADSNSPVLITVPSQSGKESWRVIGQLQVQTVQSSDGTLRTETVNVIIAVDLGNLDAATHRLQLFDLIVGGAIVVVLAAIAVALVQANLKPLNDIEMTAGQIAKGHLNHRIPERDPNTEIGSLGRSLNAMLAQVEAAFHAREQSEQAAHESEERMRRFIADASHELRTPLTTIRGFAEYYRQRGGTSFSVTDNGDSSAPTGSPSGLGRADIDRIMLRLESEASRMGLLVEDLLQLARLDQQRPLELAPVDLLTLAADAVQDARMVAPGRPVDLVVGRGGAFIVEGDEQRLRQVIANLVNNALTHTPGGTPVRVKLGLGTLVPPTRLPTPPNGAANAENGSGPGNDSDSGTDSGSGAADRTAADSSASGNSTAGAEVPAVLLDVEDDGPGMTAEQTRRVFERFYRADPARSRASGGTGLGLAIVAGLVAAHGGTVSVTSSPGEGADFQVRLPLSPGSHVDEEDTDSAAAQ
jgi:two-component system OmpR family sensor kinase